MGLNINLIRESFDAIKPHADEVFTQFYEVLFSNYPQAQALFKKTDMKKQRQSLIAAMTYVIDGFDTTPDLILKTVKKMGARHTAYGTQPEHYSWVGSALISTLAHYLGDHWTPELEAEWTALFTWLAVNMQSGATGSVEQTHMEDSHPHLQLSEMAENSTVTEKEEFRVDSLDQVARGYARSILRKALSMEVNEEFRKIARENVRVVLKEALDQEAAELMAKTKTNAA